MESYSLLFPEDPCTALELPAYSSDWDHLRKIQHFGMQRLREFYADCLDLFPVTERAQVAGRFRDHAALRHYSAVWELLFIQALALSDAIYKVEPKLENGTQPDFEVQCQGNTSKFYLETFALSGGPEQLAISSVRTDIRRWLNRQILPGYLAMTSIHSESITPPSMKQWKKQIRDWMISQPASGDEIMLTSNGWRVGLKIASSDKNRAFPLDAAMSQRAVVVNDRERISEALYYKRKKYGVTPAPLVLAPLSLQDYTDREEWFFALYGQHVDRGLYFHRGKWCNPYVRCALSSEASNFTSINPFDLRLTAWLNPHGDKVSWPFSDWTTIAEHEGVEAPQFANIRFTNPPQTAGAFIFQNHAGVSTGIKQWLADRG